MAVYDVEAAKTTGLVNRLISEKDRPLCDVWWSGEVVQTILLKEEGILAPYQSPSATGIPSQYVDPGWRWVGFGGRARVLLINTNVMTPDQVSGSILDQVKPKAPADKVGIAYHLFGAMATQAAAPRAAAPSASAPRGTAPKAVPATQQAIKYCPECGQQATWVEQYKRWYCYQCKKYLPS